MEGKTLRRARRLDGLHEETMTAVIPIRTLGTITNALGFT